MTGVDDYEDEEGAPASPPRRAKIRTPMGDAETARHVANALQPDDTDEMTTRIEGDCVVTTIERETTGGLHATVDDYVVNLHVAAQLSDRQQTRNS